MNELYVKKKKKSIWRVAISTQNYIYSQRQVPPQARNTKTLGQYSAQISLQKHKEEYVLVLTKTLWLKNYVLVFFYRQDEDLVTLLVCTGGDWKAMNWCLPPTGLNLGDLWSKYWCFLCLPRKDLVTKGLSPGVSFTDHTKTWWLWEYVLVFSLSTM